MSDEIAKMAAGFAVQQSNTVVPFGKYRGMPVEVMQQDQNYFNWAYAQEDIRKRYPWLFGLQVIQVQEMQDTPEHNSYQVLFLDQDFIDDVWDIVWPGERVEHVLTNREWRMAQELATFDLRLRNARHDSTKDEWRESYAHATPEEKAESRKIREEGQRQLALVEQEIATVKLRQHGEMLCPVRRRELPVVSAAFEVRGRYGGSADVELSCDAGGTCRIEIKPSMGDDYPSVLRQMKASGCDVLYLGHYAGSGATLAQVRKMFMASNILILLDYRA